MVLALAASLATWDGEGRYELKVLSVLVVSAAFADVKRAEAMRETVEYFIVV